MKKVLFLIPVFIVNVVLLIFLYKEEPEEPIIINNGNTTTKTTTTKAPEKEEVVVVDETNHDSLTLKSLYVYRKGNPEESKIAWYLKDGIYYLFLPKTIDRNNVCVDFTTNIGKNTYLSIYNNDNELIDKITNNKCTKAFANDNVTLKLEYKVKKTTSYKIKVMKSDLPSMYINIKGGDAAYKQIINSTNHSVAKPGYAVAIDSKNNIEAGTLREIRGRGNASWRRIKKPFQIKFEDKKSPYGMKKERTWILISNYIDGSLSRNYLFYKLAKDLKLDYSVEFETVELYINGKYNGVYFFASKVEANENRVDTNEYLFEVDHHADVNQIKLAKGNVITIHYPELEKLEKETANQVKTDAKKYLNNLESMISNQKITAEELKKHIDFDSYAKYYWVQELSTNFDALRGSSYFYVKNGKAYAGPIWDFDDTLNRSYYYAPATGYYLLNDSSFNSSRVIYNWYRGLMKREEFSDYVDKVFIDNLKIIDSLCKSLDDYEKYITNSANMNYTRWPYRTMQLSQARAWTGGSSFKSAVSTLRGLLKKRVDWYKKQYAGVLFDEFRYEIVENNNVILDKKIENKNAIANSINKEANIVIYGINGETEKKIKTIPVKDALAGKVSVKVSVKTSSSYKKYNSATYDFNFYEE